jgi:hypothetical protein
MRPLPFVSSVIEKPALVPGFSTKLETNGREMPYPSKRTTSS